MSSRNQWVLKTTCFPIAAEDESDEDAAMDIPPPSPTAAPSPTVGVGSSAALFDYASASQNLSKLLDTISLDVQ